MRNIAEPILTEIMRELEKYEEEQAYREISDHLWETGKPKLALWLCIKKQIPY